MACADRPDDGAERDDHDRQNRPTGAPPLPQLRPRYLRAGATEEVGTAVALAAA